MLYDPDIHLDSFAHERWSKMSVKELEALRDSLMQRINKITEHSEGLFEDTSKQLEKIENYIMYRKGLSNDTGKDEILL